MPILIQDQGGIPPKNFDHDKPLRPADARKLIGRILVDGKLFFSHHAQDEMAKDKMVEQDAINVLRAGSVDPAEIERGTWRYSVHTPRFCVVVTFDSETFAIVVTAWRKR